MSPKIKLTNTMKTVKTIKTIKKTNSAKKVKPLFTVDLIDACDARDIYARFAVAKMNAGITPTDNELMCVVTAIVEDIETNAIRNFIGQIKAARPVKEGFFKRLWRGFKYAFSPKSTGIVVL